MKSPAVFVGPSASRDDISSILPAAKFLPPVARDDLYRAREQGAEIFLILDGMFFHQLAISPREIVDVIRDGAIVYGAASMGALRAAECWPAGMRGVGLISRLYRSGRLESDEEVAVATNPDDGYKATSVALINVRFAASRAARRKLIDRKAALAIVEAAKAMYFPERHWTPILRNAGIVAPPRGLRDFLSACDLKKRDALDAARIVARQFDGLETHGRARRAPRAFAPAERYPGHHRLFGATPAEASRLLAEWMLGSGRYQPYIWSLVAAEPELRSPVDQGQGRLTAEGRREVLPRVLARLLDDPNGFASALWDELEFLEELDAELMRWHAVRTLGADAAEPAAEILQKVREEIAIAHGVVDWEMLREEVTDGRLFGAIPFLLVEEACHRLAQGRTEQARCSSRRPPE